MLLAKECVHLTADDWTGIAAKILRLKDGEHLVVARSDEHEGGVTSCMPDVKPVMDGFTRLANIAVFGGDDDEFESPAAFMTKLEAIRQRYDNPKSSECRQALCDEAETVLREKVQDAKARRREFLKKNPDMKVVEIIGNHENFETFRTALTELEQECPNFQWMPEMAVIPVPGGKKDEQDRLLAVHGDLQMDDLGIVEDGGTDRERKCYTHKEMAEKVVNIATSSWSPSAQKQERYQAIVDWWRKPNATAKTLYAELLFRAQEGDFHQAVKQSELNLAALQTTESKLLKRIKKFNEFKTETDQRPDMAPQQKNEETAGYDKTIERLTQRLDLIRDRQESVGKKSAALHPRLFKSPNTVLHYKKLGDNEPRLFTSKTLERITHINYGHTHVSAEAAKIKGLNGKEVTVSNNASVTGAVMRQPLDDTGKPRRPAKGEEPSADLGNLGMLLYRVREGKITGVTTVGHLITDNLQQVKQLIREVGKPQAIDPDHFGRRETWSIG